MLGLVPARRAAAEVHRAGEGAYNMDAPIGSNVEAGTEVGSAAAAEAGPEETPVGIVFGANCSLMERAG